MVFLYLSSPVARSDLNSNLKFIKQTAAAAFWLKS